MSADSKVEGVGIGGLNGKGDAVDFGFVGLGSLKVLSGTLIGTGMKSPRPDVVVTKLVVSRLVVCGSVVVRTVVVEMIVVGGSVVGMNLVVALEVIVGLVVDTDFVDVDVDDIFVVELAEITDLDTTVVDIIVLGVKVVVSLDIVFVCCDDFSTGVDCCVGLGIGFIFLSNVLVIVVGIVVVLAGTVIVVLDSGNKLFSKFIVGLSFSVTSLGTITELRSGRDIAVVDATVAFLVDGALSAGKTSVGKDSVVVEFTTASVITFDTVCVVCVVTVKDKVAAVVRLISARVDFIFVVGLAVVVTIVDFVVIFWVVTVVLIGESAAVVIIRASSSSSKVFGVVN